MTDGPMLFHKHFLGKTMVACDNLSAQCRTRSHKPIERDELSLVYFWLKDFYKKTLPVQILEMNNRDLDIIVSFSDLSMNGE